MKLVRVMKKYIMIFLCAISLFSASAQTIKLDFSGRDMNDHYVQINRVVINNLTRTWQENLYWPDTTLCLSIGSSVEDFPSNSLSPLKLTQNIPNPFLGSTQVNLFVAERGEVDLSITDISGRILVSKRLSSGPGGHQFLVTLANQGVYFLIARQNSRRSFIKMINQAGGGKNAITHIGATAETGNQPNNVLKSQTTLPFDTGDQMEYIGYAYIDGTIRESRHILQLLDTSRTIILEFLFLDNQTGMPCPNTPTLNDFDGNTYNTVQIGEQCWMKENLRATHFSNGISIPTGNAVSSSSPYRYTPNNDENYIYTYGYLYNWAAATIQTASKNDGDEAIRLCPRGWRMPDFSDWQQLVNYLRSHAEYQCGNSGQGTAKAIASRTGWLTSTNPCDVGNNTSQNNITEFNASPAGSFYNDCGFFNAKSFFWCTTENNTESAWSHHLSYNDKEILYSPQDKKFGYSVRCIKGDSAVTTLPTVSTAAVSNMTSGSALCGGLVLSDGNLFVNARGVCWSTISLPTIADFHTSDGNDIGEFTSTLYGLETGTTYYVRAYATNDRGTVYGEERSFTICSLPEVTTAPATNINATSAQSGGNVTSDGCTTVTARGVCWSTSPNPSINNGHTNEGSGTGSFVSIISGLQEGTLYHIRAYASNSVGTAYGNDVSFITPCAGIDGQPCLGTPTVTDYDGNVYQTVQIGCQCWTKQNMRTTHFSDGTSIPYSNYNDSYTTPYRYYPTDESISDLPQYGYLYNWPAAMKNAPATNNNPSGVQGICPVGWHVPSNAEWDQLMEYVRSQSLYVCQNNPSYIAKALASNTGWQTNTGYHSYGSFCTPAHHEYLNNTTGFNAYPAGNVFHSGSIYTSNGVGYFSFGHHASFWSTTTSCEDQAYRYQINCHSQIISISDNPTCYGHSIRCLRD